MWVDEHDPRFIRRLESFSDVVIGFGLALLILTFQIPAHTSDLFTHPSWLLIYLWTYGIIVGLWLRHQRLFADYFVAAPLPVALNFIVLASIGIMVFLVQVFGRMTGAADQAVAFLAYFALFGLSYVLIGVLFILGTRARWAQLDARQRYEGVRQAIASCAVALGIFGGALFARPDSMSSTTWIGVGAAVGILGGRVLARVVKARMV